MSSTLTFATIDSVQTMDCEQVIRALYLARKGLDETEAIALEEHLEGCACCSERALYTAKVLELSGRVPRVVAPDSLRVRILQAFPHRRVASGRKS